MIVSSAASSTSMIMPGLIPMFFNIVWPILVLIFFTRSKVKKQFDVFPKLSPSGQPAEAVGRLYRSGNSKVIAGVCGGFGEHFSKDPIVFRLVLVGLSLITGIIPGVIFYIICWVVMPRKDKVVKQV